MVGRAYLAHAGRGTLDERALAPVCTYGAGHYQLAQHPRRNRLGEQSLHRSGALLRRTRDDRAANLAVDQERR